MLSSLLVRNRPVLSRLRVIDQDAVILAVLDHDVHLGFVVHVQLVRLAEEGDLSLPASFFEVATRLFWVPCQVN